MGTKLKYMSRAGIYKNSTGTCIYNPSKQVATSYNWWGFYKVIDGFMVWNHHYYSQTTSAHQAAVRGFVSEDIALDVPNGLQTIHHIEQLVPLVQAEIAELTAKIPRGGGFTNERRIERLKQLKSFIADVTQGRK